MRNNHVRWLVLALILCLVAPFVPVPAQAAPGQVALTLPDEALLNDPVWARAGYAGLSQAYLSRTRYLLSLDIDHRRGLITGKARIIYVNRTPVVLDRVVLRLYPNHPVHGSRTMTVQAVTVDGSTANPSFDDPDRTVMNVPLNAPLPVGAQAVIDVDYQITVPAGANFYYVSEPFPMAAVYDETGWRTEVVTKGLDYAFSESALFVVRLRARTQIGTWFVGALKNTEEAADGTTTYTIVTGPVRNFIVIQALGWGTFDAPGGPVPIRVLYSGSQAIAQEIAANAVAAMNFFDSRFGVYPYAGFDVVAMRFPSGGEEYPSLVFINNERNAAYRRFVSAHEVAHQWFYGIAGNDTLRSAWLDESLAQVAGYLFYKWTGYADAEEYWASILTWYNRLTNVRPLNTPVMEFRDFAEYMSNTYGGGAVFFRQLAERIGEDRFIQGVRTYVEAAYLGVGTPFQFFNAIQAQTTLDLKPLFCERVGIMC